MRGHHNCCNVVLYKHSLYPKTGIDGLERVRGLRLKIESIIFIAFNSDPDPYLSLIFVDYSIYYGISVRKIIDDCSFRGILFPIFIESGYLFLSCSAYTSP